MRLYAARSERRRPRPQHEVGIDLIAFYAKPPGTSGNFKIGTPVDVRLGFVSKTPVSGALRGARIGTALVAIHRQPEAD